MKGKAPGGPTSSDDGLSWGEAWRASPEEGARDLLVVEALLASAAAGGAPQPVAAVAGPSMHG